jgi:hypothetical protein
VKRLITALLAGTIALGGSMVLAERGASATAANDAQRSYQVSGFDKVGQVGPNHVLVTVGPAVSVRAQGPRKTLDLYEVVVEHGALSIRPKDTDEWKHREWRWHDVEPATFYVTLPRLSGASTAGSGDMRIDRVTGERFAASVAGSGDIDVGSLGVGDADFSVAGSGNLVAHGRARQSRVSIAGSGEVKAREVASENASISIVGSGDVALTVRDDAHVSIMGSGDAEIAGSAHCTISRFGSGNVRCGNLAARDTHG